MKYRKLGNTGLIVSEVALGTMQLGRRFHAVSRYCARREQRTSGQVLKKTSAAGRENNRRVIQISSLQLLLWLVDNSSRRGSLEPTGRDLRPRALGRPFSANTGHSTSGQRTPQIDRGRVKT
jgi:hypothetical protein